eukprot:6932973-Prymnesium_polylepis.1
MFTASPARARSRGARGIVHRVGARFGTCIPCPPGMTQSLGVDCPPPGISPCLLRGSRPT